MKTQKRVLLIGLEPTLVDFSRSPGLNAEKVMAGLNADKAKLVAMGCDVRLVLTDTGATAEAALEQALAEDEYDCILIGAGIRTFPEHFLLFEKLINAVHRHATGAKLCFNTNPGDTAEAVQRWL